MGDLVITWKVLCVLRGFNTGLIFSYVQPLPEWEHNGPGIGYRVRQKNRGDDEWDKVIDVPGNVGRFVDLVGETNFYREYEVTVQPYNSIGLGPMSPVSVIRSAMGCKCICCTFEFTVYSHFGFQCPQLLPRTSELNLSIQPPVLFIGNQLKTRENTSRASSVATELAHFFTACSHNSTNLYFHSS